MIMTNDVQERKDMHGDRSSDACDYEAGEEPGWIALKFGGPGTGMSFDQFDMNRVER